MPVRDSGIQSWHSIYEGMLIWPSRPIGKRGQEGLTCRGSSLRMASGEGGTNGVVMARRGQGGRVSRSAYNEGRS